MRKYIPFLLLGPAANLVWGFWALPQMGEEGGVGQTLEWVLSQSTLTFLFGALLLFKKKYVYWLVAAYGGYTLLHSIGILGWGLIGEATPAAVYCVGLLLVVMGFGLIYLSLKDLGYGTEERHYDIENQ